MPAEIDETILVEVRQPEPAEDTPNEVQGTHEIEVEGPNAEYDPAVTVSKPA